MGAEIRGGKTFQSETHVLAVHEQVGEGDGKREGKRERGEKKRKTGLAYEDTDVSSVHALVRFWETL